MTKILSKAAPILGAGAGFLLGGPAGAALGLGLGGAAGGLVAGAPNTGGSGSSGINPAAFQPITAEQLDPFLARLYAPETGQGGATPLNTGIGGNNPPPGPLPGETGLPARYNTANWQQYPALADAFAQDRREVEEAGLGGLSTEQATALAQQIGAKISAAGGVPDPELANQYRIALNAAAQNRPQAGPQGGIGGAPSIAVPQINGGTPSYNIAGGVLSKTNAVVQNEFARRFPEQLAALDQLRAQVAPNVSLARKAALGQVEDARRQATGNLRQQMARRGVSGSSFGQSAESQTSAEFAKQAAQVEVQAAQQELELTTKFIDMQRTFMSEALTRDLTELGFGTELAIASGRMATDIANIQANLAAAELQAKTQLNVANIGAEASRFASTAGLLSTGLSTDASRANAELAARGGIIQAGIGSNSSALGFQTQAQIAQNNLASQEAAGRASLFGNLAGLGLGAFFNSRGSTGQFINSGTSSSGFGGSNFNFGQLGFG